MKIKVYKHNSVTVDWTTQYPKVISYFKAHGLYHSIDIEDTDITKDESVAKLMAPLDGIYDVVIFLYDRDTFPAISFGLCFPVSQTLQGIYLATDPVDNFVDYSWKSMCHELMHALFYRYTTTGGGQIPMDNMLVNGLWTPYYQNENLSPDGASAPGGNFAIAWAMLKTYTYGIILGMRILKIGMKGDDVKTLQNALGIASDGSFGQDTLFAVKAFQEAHSLTPDGIVGANTFTALVHASQTGKIDLWITQIKQMEGALPSRNNPGNLRFIGQQYATDDAGFCKFDTYQHGYDALKSMLVNACTGKSKIYEPTMTLYDFYNKYAPASDGNNPKHYAEFVASGIGVPPTIQIKDLV